MKNLRVEVTPRQGRAIRRELPEKFPIPSEIVEKYNLQEPYPDFDRVVFVEPDRRTTIFNFEGIDKLPDGYQVRLGDQPFKIKINA